jgi:hypothetical protein
MPPVQARAWRKAINLSAMPRRFWVISLSIALVLLIGNALSVAIVSVLAFAKHRGVPVSYFVAIAVCGYLSWSIFQSLRRKARARDAESNNVTTK